MGEITICSKLYMDMNVCLMPVCIGIKILAVYKMLENYLSKLSAKFDWLFKAIQETSMPNWNLMSFICYKKILYVWNFCMNFVVLLVA